MIAEKLTLFVLSVPKAEPLLLNRFVAQLKEGHTTPADLKEILEAKLMPVDEVTQREHLHMRKSRL